MTIVTLRDDAAKIQELSSAQLDQVTAGHNLNPALVAAGAGVIGVVGAAIYGFFRSLFAGE